MKQPSRTRTIAIAAIVGIVALSIGVLLARAVLNRPAQSVALAHGTLLSPSRPLPPLHFTDHHGAVFDDTRLQGRWTLLFFGFTSCPDVCPMTLGVLAQVEKALADLPESARPHVVLVSVDPQRDTPEQLAKYVSFFSPSFTGVTAPQPVIEEFTRKLGVPVAITPQSGGGYTVDHSGAIFAVGPHGGLSALFSPPHTVEGLANDLRLLTQGRADG